MNTKEKIIDCAIELFNKQGLSFTSMRDIASACDMSLGNLTYHFHKKEDLIAAIMNQNLFTQLLNTQIETIDELYNTLKSSVLMILKLRFYFLELSYISTIESLKHRDNQVSHQLFWDFKKNLKYLEDKGYFQFGDDTILNGVASIIWDAHLGWITHQFSNDSIALNRFMKLQFDLLKGFATPLGKQEIQKLEIYD